MDSSSIPVIIEALTKFFNPKFEKERAENQLKQDLGALEALLAIGLSIEYLEYRDGRLNFKMVLPEISDTPNANVISVEDLKRPPSGYNLIDGDDGKLKLAPPPKKYE